jgi:hypothetical protein
VGVRVFFGGGVVRRRARGGGRVRRKSRNQKVLSPSKPPSIPTQNLKNLRTQNSKEGSGYKTFWIPNRGIVTNSKTFWNLNPEVFRMKEIVKAPHENNPEYGKAFRTNYSVEMEMVSAVPCFSLKRKFREVKDGEGREVPPWGVRGAAL